MNNQGKLLLVPAGGLANRMHAIASVYELCRQTEVELQVVWFQDWALHAPFRSIFRPTELVNIREATIIDHVVYDRPRRRNFYIPRLFQNMIFDQRIDEQQMNGLLARHFDFHVWARGHRSYMSCCQDFGQFDDGIYAELFRPVAEVESAVGTFTDRFSSHTIGFHIRRTDNRRSIEGSPLSLFVEAGRREIDEHTDTKIFLATDDEPTKQQLHREFGNRLMMQPAAASRGSIDGIRGGLTDMYTLARTRVIYGSTGSSFSIMASRLGGNKLVILEK
ncbi:MAG: hypothetical protein ACOYJK_04945 [Prevotella sp.]|jgi:hypothetical protein